MIAFPAALSRDIQRITHETNYSDRMSIMRELLFLYYCIRTGRLCKVFRSLTYASNAQKSSLAHHVHV